MISYIKGTLIEIGESWIILESGDIGYQLFIPTSSFSQLPSVGEKVRIFTYLQIREDIFMLYGFLNREGVQLFQQLISVTGIGPKGAMGVLSALTPEEVYFAVLSEDIKTLCIAPGIGKKTAQRMILELKDKLKIENVIQPAQELSQASSQTIKEEAIDALESLGYQRHDAFKAIQGVGVTEGVTVENLIKEGLKILAKTS
ncbi:MAG: Holliday junction branch migration protein RuvA [Epulopiscium sp.]|nr:Holliday junction branch migration protein RuvA [Candidatus Epulonipiscium sp.]